MYGTMERWPPPTAAVVRRVRASARRRPRSPVRALPVLRRPLAHQVGWGGVGRGLWRRLLAWFPVCGIATVSSSVLAQFVTLLAPLLAGTQTDCPK